MSDRTVVRTVMRRRFPLECRECASICEWVVSPWECLKSGCTGVYAYEEDGTTYFGCLYKIFSVELDLAAFTGSSGQAGRGGLDPYGPIRVVRAPRPECRARIERGYDTAPGTGGCRNPGFLRDGVRQGR